MTRFEIVKTVLKMAHQREMALQRMGRLDDERQGIVRTICYWWDGKPAANMNEESLRRTKDLLAKLTPPEDSRFYKGYIKRLDDLTIN